MRKETVSLIILMLLSAALMSIPFLVPHCGIAALIGLVPLLCMERIAEVGKIKRFWIWHYSTFVLWNAATTFWVCISTVGGGLFAVFANALQMSLIFGLFRWSKKTFRSSLPYIFLAFMWIAWERFYFSAEISWPWLTLGNSFARTTSLVQWYEYTGSLGGSLWIWACNLAVFGLLCLIADDDWRRLGWKARLAAITGTVVVFVAPVAVSEVMYKNYEETGEPLDVLIAQPNIDPYHKFVALSQDSQDAILDGLIQDAMKGRDTADITPLLILGPETFTSGVDTDNIGNSKTFRRLSRIAREYPGTNVLFGASTWTYIFSDERPSETARKVMDGIWVECHNSAIITDGSDDYDIFHKSRLVVGVELMPYPKIFRPLDEALGGVIGRDIGQDEISLLNVRTQDGGKLPLGCAICYESVYGEYCTGYVRKGAKALTVITNDAWWADTPGYRQHLSYASLRAIETRRDIARCANTGISAIIDQRGDIVSRTTWWEPEVLSGTINLTDGETFFVRNGDVTGKFCTFIFLLLLLALVTRSFIPKSLRK